MAAQYPRTANRFAAEGTAAHELAAWCLRDGADAAAYAGRVIEVDGFTFTVDAEMIAHVQGYVDRTRAWLQFEGAVLHVEQPLAIGDITGEEDATGTGDAILFVPAADGYDLVVRDLKYGRGVPVFAVENDQLVLYGGGALAQFACAYDIPGTNQVHLEIDQPRRGHVDRWTIPVSVLRQRLADIAADAKVALMTPADGKRVPGDWCQFCAEAATCKARAESIESAMVEGFENLATVADDSAERLAGYMGKIGAIRAWCSAVEQEAHNRIARGDRVPGWKLVAGREGNREWADAKVAETTLVSYGAPRSAIFTEPTLKSPAQVEKLIPKDARQFLVPLIRRGAPKAQLAPESDPRPALAARTAGFDNLDEPVEESIL